MTAAPPSRAALQAVVRLTAALVVDAEGDRLTLSALGEALEQRKELLRPFPDATGETAWDPAEVAALAQLDGALLAWCGAYHEALTRVAARRSTSQPAATEPSRLVSEAA